MLIVTGVTIVILFVILSPILFVVFISFTNGETFQFPPPGWGLRWYRSALELTTGQDWRVERLSESILTSMAIAITVMFIATMVSVPTSYALVRFRFKGKMLVEQLVSLPLVFPLIVLGVSLLIMFSNLGLSAGFKGIVIGHVIITFPFVVRNCTASLQGISPTLEEAGWTLGASWIQTFWKIVLPLMRPGMLSGMLIAFILSFNEFTVTYFLFTSEVFPFPIWLFTRASCSLDPTIFSLSSAVIALDIVLLIVINRVVGKVGVSM
jgi:putative spermidine/putrescine transport system permease protein